MTDVVTNNPDPEAQTYLDGLGRGVLLLQRCEDCGRRQFPPRVLCVSCGSQATTWDEVDGAGMVYARTVNRRAPEPPFEALLPYAVALVDLDAGVRVMARADCRPDEVVTGMRVRVFPDRAPVLLPGLLFSPASPDMDSER